MKMVRSYRTDFSSTENPISEGGMWLNGRKDGVDWIDVVCAGGYAHGEVSRMTAAERRVEQGNLQASDDTSNPEGDYDDPSAVLTGAWGPEPAREGNGVLPEPDRGVLPGGAVPTAQRNPAECVHGL